MIIVNCQKSRKIINLDKQVYNVIVLQQGTTMTIIVELGMYGKEIDEQLKSIPDIVIWKDEWMRGNYPYKNDYDALFHGSLNVYKWICENNCTNMYGPQYFNFKSWQSNLKRFCLNDSVECINLDSINQYNFNTQGASKLFVRPNSCLKQFSGRVIDAETFLDKNKLNNALDRGFYYEEDIKIVYGPAKENITDEIRLVISDGNILGYSGYDGKHSAIKIDQLDKSVEKFINDIYVGVCIDLDGSMHYDNILQFFQKAPFILDICKHDGKWKIVEVGPFYGCDLYCMDVVDVFNKIRKILWKSF